MVRSKSYCFKVICGGGGGDSIDVDDLKQPEGKGSVDKRGWNFRKRPTKNRVLSNTLTTEIPSPRRKESLEATNLDFLTKRNPSNFQKSSVLQWAEETPPLSSSVNFKTSNSLTVKESAVKVEALVSTGSAEQIGSLITSENNSSKNLEESSAMIIQAAIRSYLARRELLKLKNKLKNIVKLQAAFRGHLERRKAIGTLRCVQAIVKMQALVRARSARLSLQESATEEKMDVNHEKIIESERKIQSGSTSNIKSSSMEKFLSNGFARQLLESAPNRKQIHIKCDPSKADSAWKWLERWVSVSTSESAQTQNPASVPVFREGESVGSASGKTRMPIEIVSNSASLKHNGTKETSKPESEENTVTYDADNFKFQACHPSTFPKSDITCDLQHDGKEFTEAHNTSMDDVMSQMEVKLDATCQVLPVSVSKKFEAGGQHSRGSMKRAASEQPETGSNKLDFGSRKTRDPAFAAVQSKFEELSSLTTSVTTNTYSQAVGVDRFSSMAESETKKNERFLEESVNTQEETRVHIGGSDCGTELSISSTLDSPNSSQVEVVEFEPENDIVEKITSEFDNGQHVDVLNKNSIVTSESISPQHENLDDAKGVETVVTEYSSPFERSASDMQVQLETHTIQPAYSLSPEAPSSQVSVKGGKRNTLDRSRKSLSTSKRSPSNPNHDSGGRRSVEKLPPKDPQNGRRRNSFGSSRHDHGDHDSSLPSYMQATESARAKALLTGSSPRSSPDVQDKDNYLIRKRHSLPGANAKQVSPRIQLSLSQVQQGANGYGANNQDRKWVR